MRRVVPAAGQLIARVAPSLYEPLRETYRYLRFWAGQPHDPDFRFFQRVGPGPGLFIDAGANGGISALSFACMNDGFRIHSFEPNERLTGQLARVQRVLGQRFAFTMCALGAETREVSLFIPICQGIELSAEAALARETLEDPETRERIGKPFAIVTRAVRVSRLDVFGLAPDIVKLDVQGWELDVLRGAVETLARHQPALLIEYNHATPAVMAYLAPMGYRFYRYDTDCRRVVPWADDRPSRNYFALLADRHATWLGPASRNL